MTQKNRHMGTIPQLCQAISSQLRHISTIGKNLLSSLISSTCLYNMVNVGPLAAEIVLGIGPHFQFRFSFSFWATVCKTVHPVLSDYCLSVCPVCDVGVMWPNSWIDKDETWRQALAAATLCQMGTELPLPKRGTAPSFRRMSVVAKWLDVLRCYLMWRQASALATLCQMGTHPSKGTTHAAPVFGPCLWWQDSWMDQDPTWQGGRHCSSRHYVRWGAAPPPPSGKGPSINCHHLVDEETP